MIKYQEQSSSQIYIVEWVWINGCKSIISAVSLSRGSFFKSWVMKSSITALFLWFWGNVISYVACIKENLLFSRDPILTKFWTGPIHNTVNRLTFLLSINRFYSNIVLPWLIQGRCKEEFHKVFLSIGWAHKLPSRSHKSSHDHGRLRCFKA